MILSIEDAFGDWWHLTITYAAARGEHYTAAVGVCWRHQLAASFVRGAVAAALTEFDGLVTVRVDLGGPRAGSGRAAVAAGSSPL